MASFRHRNLRIALVDCAPPLARIHERLFSALGLREIGVPGRPGGGGLLISTTCGVNYDERNNATPESIPGRQTNQSGEVSRCFERESRTASTSPDGGCVVPGVLLDGVSVFAREYFAKEWLSKLDSVGDPSEDRRMAANRDVTTWERFAEAEESCFHVNQRSRREWRLSPFEPVIQLARKLADDILGPMDLDSAARGFGWGPGATTRLTRRKSDAAHKYSGTPHSTIGNAILANAALAAAPIWARELPVLGEDEGVGYVKIVPGNRVVTVPKNYKTDRTIAIEPDMNIYVQKGFGGLLRARLKAIGVNLDDQTKNQRLAQVGSYAGSLATIDLSMASDTISRAVVERLIRPDWLDALGQSRSLFGVLPSGEKIFYQKFSSMGNGYTFELETLIFYVLALAYASIHGEEVTRISVYGDDIIVPNTMAVGFSGLLSFLGFRPNEKKSYWSGPFRESCGKHYFRGYDVTPFYVKKRPRTLIDLFKIHNQIWRFQARSEWMSEEMRSDVLAVCSWLRGFAPAKWRRPSIIDGIGDGSFVGYFDEVLPDRASHGWDGYLFRTVLTLPVHDDSLESHGLLVKSLARTKFRTWDVDKGSIRNACLILEDEADVGVFPVKGQRYAAGKVFLTTSQLRRQCTGPLHPEG